MGFIAVLKHFSEAAEIYVMGILKPPHETVSLSEKLRSGVEIKASYYFKSKHSQHRILTPITQKLEHSTGQLDSWSWRSSPTCGELRIRAC